MKKQIRRCMMVILMGLLVSIGAESQAEAAENADIRVQSGEVKEDGILRTSVYMNGVSNLGGIELEMTYDPSKVEYAGSGLGQSFADGIGETHCKEETATIKCVVIYASGKNANGELMYALFRLKDGVASYQPTVKIIDIVDDSIEMQAIPCTLSFQQANGEWMDMPDVSGEVIEAGKIQESRDKYGAKEDQEDRLAEELKTGERSAEDRLKDQGIDIEDMESDTQQGDKEAPKGQVKTIAIAGVLLVICVVGIIIWQTKKRKK